MEVWKPILNYEGLYEVSNTGKIKSLKKSIIMKPPTNNSGYKTKVNCGVGYRRMHHDI
ncbi:hypothetical protein GZH82_05510 [Staphylococcus ursi]|uniref:NUMOD4 domain-containing protein n=1 Tax=Staphylococcus sp. MI 10-1553 TaxID=1912064 RepID=UPI0013993A2A|nr:NUMOD4 domain-containing protein [Staphylococcus sp. MI 10-1553]QHW36822.1 hypothetical protein GZH82_05510 [Staphylococcus sp. MI 10-1553]